VIVPAVVGVVNRRNSFRAPPEEGNPLDRTVPDRLVDLI